MHSPETPKASLAIPIRQQTLGRLEMARAKQRNGDKPASSGNNLRRNWDCMITELGLESISSLPFSPSK